MKAGDPLFTLNSDTERAARDEAKRRLAQGRASLEDAKKGRRPSEIESMEAQIRQAQASLEFSEKEFARQEKLIQIVGGTSQADFDRARSTRDGDRQRVAQLEADLKTARLGARPDQVAAAEANVRALEAALAKAEWDLSQKRRPRPKAGWFSTRLYREGEWVAAGRPVVVLLPPPNIKVRAFVPETQIGGDPSGRHGAGYRRRRGEPVLGQGELHFAAGRIHPAGHLQPGKPRKARLHDRGGLRSRDRRATCIPASRWTSGSGPETMTDDLAIDVHGMTKRFGDRTVVNDIDLQVATGVRSTAFSARTAAARPPSSACSAACSRADAGQGTCLGYDVITESESIKRAGRLHDAAVQFLRRPEHRGEPRFRRPHVWRGEPARGRARRASSGSDSPDGRTNWPASFPAAGSSASPWPPA